MLSHSSTRAVQSSQIFAGTGTRWCTWQSLEDRHVFNFQKRCAQPSDIKVEHCHAEQWHYADKRKGATTVFLFPWMICSCVQCSWHMPPESITPRAPSKELVRTMQSMLPTMWMIVKMRFVCEGNTSRAWEGPWNMFVYVWSLFWQTAVRDTPLWVWWVFKPAGGCKLILRQFKPHTESAAA